MSLASSDFGEEGFEDSLGELSTDASMGMEETPAPPAEPTINYRKQGFSIYSVMLILSFIFLTIAMIFFYQEAGRLQ